MINSSQANQSKSRAERLVARLSEALQPEEIQVENESNQHAVPKGSESHFLVILVADVFEGMSRLDRQRKVNDLLEGEFQSGLHALSLRLFSPEEWKKAKGSWTSSPDCKGSSF